MKIVLNKPILDTAYGGSNHFLNMLRNYLIHDKLQFVKSYKEADVLFITGTRDYNTTFWINEIKEAKNKKIIFRVNDCDKPRGTDYMDKNVQEIFKYANQVIFVSEWCKEYFKNKGITHANSTVIPNVPNTDLFKGIDRKENDTLKVVTHHFSNNLQKGGKYYEYLASFCKSRGIIFRYIGNYDKKKIDLKHAEVFPAIPYHRLPRILEDCDLYVTAAYAESGANHIMEGVCCGLVPLVHNEGGSTVEYTKDMGFVFGNEQGLAQIIQEFDNNRILLLNAKHHVRMITKGLNHNDMLKKYKEVILK